MDQIKQTLLANAILLRGVVETDGMVTPDGLCYLLMRGARHAYGGEFLSYDDGTTVLDPLFEAWPEYSGELFYPVPCPHGGSPRDAFNFSGDEMFTGEYGAARIRLLQFIIDTLTKELT